jgi:hypothetical protein
MEMPRNPDTFNLYTEKYITGSGIALAICTVPTLHSLAPVLYSGIKNSKVGFWH